MEQSETTRASRRSVIFFAIALMLGAALAVVISKSTELLAVGIEAPAFELSTADDGRQVSLESLRGKLILLDFWSTSCPPCVRQLGDLELIHQRFDSDDLVILGINSEGASPRLINDFARGRGVRYTVLVDNGFVSNLYRIESLPTLYLIDREGLVQWSRVGYIPHEELLTVIRNYI